MSQQGKVLVIEDDQELAEALEAALTSANYNVTVLENAESALAQLEQVAPDIVVSDINMPGMNGNELLKIIKKKQPLLPVILITAYGNVHDAVKAMQSGASDYLVKPFKAKDLETKIKQYILTEDNLDEPVAEAPTSKELLALASRVAQSDATVLICGESGTGKEVLAQYIHNQSPRKDKPFIAINCAAIPDNMLEATLFGHEKGAFTGAHQAAPGKFELAQEGTILLDEISEMSMALQAKLLRVLQEREVERLGGRKTIKLNVRVLATSNRNLMEEVQAGNFREDLFYRLNVFPLSWLSLRERIADIVPIAERLMGHHANRLGKVQPSFTTEAKQKLINHTWPGNVRELDNVIQRALILQVDEYITEHELQFEINQDALNKIDEDFESKTIASQKGVLGKELKHAEYQMILDALEEEKGSRKDVAIKLGISPRTLRYKLAKMRELGMAV